MEFTLDEIAQALGQQTLQIMQIVKENKKLQEQLKEAEKEAEIQGD